MYGSYIPAPNYFIVIINHHYYLMGDRHQSEYEEWTISPLKSNNNKVHSNCTKSSLKYPIPFMQHQRSMWLVVVTMTARQNHASDTPSVKR